MPLYTPKQQIRSAVSAAHAAALAGAATRKRLRRKAPRGAPQREEQLAEALADIAAAGRLLAPLSARIQWGRIAPSDEERLIAASAELDRERRKLRKMLR